MSSVHVNHHPPQATLSRRLVLLAVLCLLFATAWAQTSTITYQGQLRNNGTPFTGMVNLEFRLYDALVGGNPVGAPQTLNNWPVEDGLFQAEIDFGAAAFDGSDRWLEVWVNGAPLTPRQQVTSAPYALHAGGTDWNGIVNIPADLADGDDDTLYSAGTGLTLTGTIFSADASVLQR